MQITKELLCSQCHNRNICKWIETFVKTTKEVELIKADVNPDSPIEVADVKCKMFRNTTLLRQG